MNLTGSKKHQSRSNRNVVEPAAHAPVTDGASRTGAAPDTGAVGDGTARAGGPIPEILAAGAHAASTWGAGYSKLLQIIL